MVKATTRAYTDHMKKKTKWWLLAGCAVLLAVAGGLFAMQRMLSPDSAVDGFLSAWQEQDYTSMYSYLSEDSKGAITEEAFVKRHQAIYDGVEAKKLALIREKEKEGSKGPTHEFRYRLSMDTVAGPVKFEQSGVAMREGRNWKVQWNPSYLHPQLGEGDRVNVQTLTAERGEIFDRNGKGLAVNDEQVEIGLVPSKLGTASVPALAKKLGISESHINQKLKAPWVQPDYFVPITVLPKQDTRLAGLSDIPGVTSQYKKVRYYPLSEAAAHLIGYTSEGVGKTGLEVLYEETLHGTDGAIITIHDSAGNEKSVVAKKEAKNGESMKITLDADLQTSVYGQIQKDVGGTAAIHPLTGEVLALVSAPSYDPNEMVRGVSEEQWKRWNEDPDRPFLNRFASLYSPGSAFKPLTAAIALDSQAITPAQTYTIKGLNWQKDASWGNYRVTRVSERFSEVDLEKAMLTSDNIYFAKAALAMGESAFTAAAAPFGFGEKLPLPYPVDPSTLANDGIKNEIQLADSGYGQGEVLMSPLHVAVAYTAFLNKGNVLAPELLHTEGQSTGRIWKQNAITAQSADIVARDMIQVVEHPAGTGYAARINGLKLAGKTGTAELKAEQGTTGKEYGWFVAYDAEHPQLLVAMMIENVQRKGGSHYLAPKIRHLYQTRLLDR